MKKPQLIASDLIPVFRSILLSDTICIAYSGGLDSHVLLHVLSQIKSELNVKLKALHVNHGFSEEATNWVSHCEITCQKLGVQIETMVIDQVCPVGESLEAWARDKRYELLTKMSAKDVLVTAHHKEDQAETLLLQLNRGAGVRGLASMPIVKERAKTTHLRPLLAYDREQITQYANKEGLHWIEDESNNNKRFDRNYIRHEILPKLRERWPAIDSNYFRVSSLQAQASELLDDLARIDLVSLQTEHDKKLELKGLKLLSRSRRNNAVRYWLRSFNIQMPSASQMEQISINLIESSDSASPLIKLAGYELRRYRDWLYLVDELENIDFREHFNLELGTTLTLNDESQLQTNWGAEVGIKLGESVEGELQVRYRQGGERIHLPGKTHTQSLKQLFQEAAVPPWIRERVPLFFIDTTLVGVAGFWIDEAYISDGTELAWKIIWKHRYVM